MGPLSTAIEHNPIATGVVGLTLGALLGVLYDKHFNKCECKDYVIKPFTRLNNDDSITKIKDKIDNLVKMPQLTETQQEFLIDNMDYIDIDQTVDMLIMYPKKNLLEKTYRAFSLHFYRLYNKVHDFDPFKN
jgi:hypothetical protein